MNKIKKKYVCKKCGFTLLKWEGCCPECGEWNSLVELLVDNSSVKLSVGEVINPTPLNEVRLKNEERFDTKIDEINLLFGGGIVKGSISLIAGDPGIGKSTLLLQICGNLCQTLDKVLYVSGEENISQIKLRADRLKINYDNLLILSETVLDRIDKVISNEKPELVIIDSIQTMSLKGVESFAGSVVQVRESTYLLQKISKTNNISIILVGHVNKEGNIAGPKILEHIVDTVLYFEGDSKNSFRILRVVKNRFGSINEISMFDMKEEGLFPMVNPCAALISERLKSMSGSFICAIMQGKRPFFVEIQSLVIKLKFGFPKRLCKGIDYNKLIIIIAVLEKRVGIFFQNVDCYVNVVGGFKLEDPICDLAVALSLVAALKDIKIEEDIIVLGEIGLGGEIRGVFGVERIIMQAEKLGFKKIMLPYFDLKNLTKINNKLELIGVKNLKDAVEKIM